MPEINGLTFVDDLRHQYGLTELPVIMLTSGDRPDDSVRCRELGISVRLPKPIKQSGLFDEVPSGLGITEPDGPMGTASFPAATVLMWGLQFHLSCVCVRGQVVKKIRQRTGLRAIPQKGEIPSA